MGVCCVSCEVLYLVVSKTSIATWISCTSYRVKYTACLLHLYLLVPGVHSSLVVSVPRNWVNLDNSNEISIHMTLDLQPWAVYANNLTCICIPSWMLAQMACKLLKSYALLWGNYCSALLVIFASWMQRPISISLCACVLCGTLYTRVYQQTGEMISLDFIAVCPQQGISMALK